MYLFVGRTIKFIQCEFPVVFFCRCKYFDVLHVHKFFFGEKRELVYSVAKSYIVHIYCCHNWNITCYALLF